MTDRDVHFSLLRYRFDYKNVHVIHREKTLARKQQGDQIGHFLHKFSIKIK